MAGKKDRSEQERHWLYGKKAGLFSLIIIVFLLLCFIVLFSVYRHYLGEDDFVPYEGFARCITEKGTVLAGTNWCDGCKTTQDMFGEAFRYIEFRNCDIQKRYCQDNDITTYPTWVLKSGEKEEGYLSFEELSDLTGCRIN